MASALRSSARHLRSPLTIAALAFRPIASAIPRIAAAGDSPHERPSQLPARSALHGAPIVLAAAAESAQLRGPSPPSDPHRAAVRHCLAIHGPCAGLPLPQASATLLRPPPLSAAPLSTLSASPRHTLAAAIPRPSLLYPRLTAPSALAVGGLAAASVIQTRGVFVEVKRGDVERAIKKFKIKLRIDNSIRVLRARSHFTPPAQLKRLRGMEADIRRRQREFREKLAWIMGKRARGF